jgi:hypothetical protein
MSLSQNLAKSKKDMCISENLCEMYKSPKEKKQTITFPLKDDFFRGFFLYLVEPHLFMCFSPRDRLAGWARVR